MVPVEEDIPGEARPVRAVLALPDERVGVLVGHLPATRAGTRRTRTCSSCTRARSRSRCGTWSCSSRSSSSASASSSSTRRRTSSCRGISHNLQTPLTSIRARRADRLGASGPAARDHRRAVRAAVPDRAPARGDVAPRVGHAPPGQEVLALAPRVRRAWDALAAVDVPFELRTRPRAGLPSPTRTSSTRSSGRCSTTRRGTPGSGDSAPPWHPGPRARAARGDHRRRRSRRPPGGPRPDLRAVRARRRGRERGRDRARAVRSRSLCQAMGGDLVLEPAASDTGPRSPSCSRGATRDRS